ncbi:hypothetical protein PB2503_03697 [Parvularcula bermudensis HTCC2503]|uniref:Uncharacterized protein n=1 Tax=Parvularcula bermudensis (strain ATCC BAA-594 / HTCC2503 / KCTC 12087) TaxID=314260 RepID=E0TDZ3_PARBH|nr:hypothetical protein PB2503_03697 [Parvularcula bermudensis HTCC2503]
MAIRYYDEFARVEGTWYFANRTLIIDWSEIEVSAA